jgi:hypothetical protein
MAFQFYCPQGHLLEGHESQMGQQSQCPMCGAIFVIPVVQTGPAPGGWPPGYAPQQGYVQPQPYGQPGYGQAGYGQPGYAPPGYAPPPGYGQPPPGAPQPGFPPQGFPGMAPAGAQPGWAPGPQQSPEMNFPGAAPSGFPGAPPGASAPDVGPGPTAEAAPQIHVGPSAAPSEAAAPPAEPAKPAEPEKKEPRIVRIPCPQGHELQTPMDMVNQDVLCPICNTQFHLRYEDSIEFKQEQADLRRRKEEELNQAALKWAIIAAVVVVVGILGMIIYLKVRSPAESTYPSDQSAPPAASESAESQPAGSESDADGAAQTTPAETGSEAKEPAK